VKRSGNIKYNLARVAGNLLLLLLLLLLLAAACCCFS
jgi:hypothetical protein